MQFKYYVLNYNHNAHKVELFNIFQNWQVNDDVLEAIKKYKVDTLSFNDLKEEILEIIRWQMWSRFEYEISVGYAFETDCEKLQKIDCYQQCKMNIDAITREVLYQYNKYLEDENNDETRTA